MTTHGPTTGDLMTTNDVPADTGDDLIERLARTFADECPEGCGSASSGWVAHRDDAEALLSARDSAQRDGEAERIAQAIEAMTWTETARDDVLRIARSGTAGGSNA